MAMLIAWQTINERHRSGNPKFSRGFLVVAPGLTIKNAIALPCGLSGAPFRPPSHFLWNHPYAPQKTDLIFRRLFAYFQNRPYTFPRFERISQLHV
jgi:hypothetical protein